VEGTGPGEMQGGAVAGRGELGTTGQLGWCMRPQRMACPQGARLLLLLVVVVVVVVVGWGSSQGKWRGVGHWSQCAAPVARRRQAQAVWRGQGWAKVCAQEGKQQRAKGGCAQRRAVGLIAAVEAVAGRWGLVRAAEAAQGGTRWTHGSGLW